MGEVSWFEEWYSRLPWYRKLMYQVWDRWLYWWIDDLYAWLTDAPYWTDPQDGSEPQCLGWRSGKAKDPK